MGAKRLVRWAIRQTLPKNGCRLRSKPPFRKSGKSCGTTRCNVARFQIRCVYVGSQNTLLWLPQNALRDVERHGGTLSPCVDSQQYFFLLELGRTRANNRHMGHIGVSVLFIRFTCTFWGQNRKLDTGGEGVSNRGFRNYLHLFRAT